jgi:cell division protein FtsB
MFLASVALVFTAVTLFRELQKKYEIQSEIRRLEAEIANLDSKNREIQELISYYQTSEYKERQARALLNLQKPGEFAVVLPERDDDQGAAELEADPGRVSNFQKWWEYYFGNN